MLRAVGNPLAGLSDRELAVAAKFAEGMTYREIGETLFIAPTTVRTHFRPFIGSSMFAAKWRLLGYLPITASRTAARHHPEAFRPTSRVRRSSQFSRSTI
ncbi:hypothetical protein AJ88_46015 [Mesorhizobium amorphae CCBAU 01583]|nr:hypothetical protein AJ88_46015 [Mesorhizobium amorphae CCBAU 01583]